MSAELITLVSGAIGMMLTVAAGFGWMIRRMDTLESRLSERIDGVADEIVEVKIAIARLEGPQPRLVSPR